MKALWLALVHTGGLLGGRRRIWVPFLITAVVELLLIGLVWLAPHPPFSKVLAPPIRYFFGDRVLHYPWHLWFLFHSMKHASVVAATLIGAYMTGVAAAMIQAAHEGGAVTMHRAVTEGRVKFGRVVLLWLILWGAVKSLMELLSGLAPENQSVLWAGIVASVMLQALLSYAIPITVFEGKNWWRAGLASVKEAARYPLSTLVVTGIPSALSIAFAIVMPSPAVARWMTAGEPEIVLPCIAARLLVLTVSDALLTVGISHLWWFHRPERSVLAGRSTLAVGDRPTVSALGNA